MAAGYALVTGRGQGVLVHVDVGTANTATAMHNMFRSRLPVLLMAGKAPYTSHNELVGTRDTHVHWVQEPFDQASLVRPYLKWEWTLPSGVVVKEVLRRAHSIMQSEPRGPVYLMMQRETLTQPWALDEIHRYSAERFGAMTSGGADPKLVAALAERLIAAENPILITGYGGRNARAAEMIAEVAEFAGIAVFEGSTWSNIGHLSPSFAGFAPDKALPEADVGMLVDVDVPWFPADVQPNEQSFWAHIDVDVLKAGSPMWTFPGDLRLQGDSGRILEQLLAELRAEATPRFAAAAARRLERLKAARAERVAHAARLAADKGQPDAINPHYLMAELAKVLDDEDIIFNEAVRNTPAVLMQIARRLPNTTVATGGAGLGWSGGMALGAKLAAPDRLMVQVTGDGSFYFGGPCSVFATAQQYKLPIFCPSCSTIPAGRRSRRRPCASIPTAKRPPPAPSTPSSRRSSSARSAKRSAPMPRRSAIPPACPTRSRAARPRCAAAVRHCCTRASRGSDASGVVVGRDRIIERDRARAHGVEHRREHDRQHEVQDHGVERGIAGESVAGERQQVVRRQVRRDGHPRTGDRPTAHRPAAPTR